MTLVERLRAMSPDTIGNDAADRIEQLEAENLKLKSAMTGWNVYGWKYGAYIDDIGEYLDSVINNNSSQLNTIIADALAPFAPKVK